MLGLIYQAQKRSSAGSSSRLRSCGASFMAPVRNARRDCWSRWSFSSKNWKPPLESVGGLARQLSLNEFIEVNRSASEASETRFNKMEALVLWERMLEEKS